MCVVLEFMNVKLIVGCMEAELLESDAFVSTVLLQILIPAVSLL